MAEQNPATRILIRAGRSSIWIGRAKIRRPSRRNQALRVVVEFGRDKPGDRILIAHHAMPEVNAGDGTGGGAARPLWLAAGGELAAGEEHDLVNATIGARSRVAIIRRKRKRCAPRGELVADDHRAVAGGRGEITPDAILDGGGHLVEIAQPPAEANGVAGGGEELAQPDGDDRDRADGDEHLDERKRADQPPDPEHVAMDVACVHWPLPLATSTSVTDTGICGVKATWRMARLE